MVDVSATATSMPRDETTLRPMGTAPRDGTPFWGREGNDLIRMLWHAEFNAFVSEWRQMRMAPGLRWITKDGVDCGEVHNHSPTTHDPDGWLPLPKGME